MNIVVWKRPLFLLLLILIGGVLTVASEVNAEESTCGDIVAPGYFFNPTTDNQTIERQSISDCADPFTVDDIPPSPYTLKVDGNEVLSGGAVTVAVGGTRDIFIDGWVPFTEMSGYLFKHEGGDYVYIDRRTPEITDEQYIEYAPVYFANFPDKELYEEIITAHYETGLTGDYFYDEEGEYVLDAQGASIYDNFMAFFDAAEEALTVPPPVVRAGTYTMVIKESVIALVSKRTWGQVLKDLFIPTVYAQEYIPPLTYTITFTVIEGEQSSASSVLFLPGIQASRLYKDGILGTEDQIWTPDGNQDMWQLAMDENGESLNDIYTKDILDEVFGLGNVYKNFAGFLDNLVSSGKIKSWEPYAYDWRYSVVDLASAGTKYENEIKNAVEIVNNLATDSYSNKVTIIAHSNGGLLAKAIIEELKRQGKDGSVDQLILLASPQLGTPKAIGTILHGFDQAAAGGLAIDASVARGVVSNMPGAYGLLPNQDYISSDVDKVISFQEGEATKIFTDVYGNSIDSEEELNSFLNSELDSRPSASSVYDASIANSSILNKSRLQQGGLTSAWIAPSNIKVTEVVGVGLPTVSGFEYRNYKQKTCRQELFTEVCATDVIYKPVPKFTLWGDETVIANSAEAYAGNKETYYFDLMKQGDLIKIKHVNFTEAESVQDLVKSLLLSLSDENIPFITMDKNSQTIQNYNILSSHSPVNLIVEDQDGNVVKIESEGDFNNIIEDIPGSVAFYHGSTTYILVPQDEDYFVSFAGTGRGSVTLEVETLTERQQSLEESLYIDDIYQGSLSDFEFNDNNLPIDIKVDLDGDGKSDYLYDFTTGYKSDINSIATSTELVSETKKSSSRPRLISLEVAPKVGLVGAVVVYNNENYYKQLHQLLSQLLILLEMYVQKNS